MARKKHLKLLEQKQLEQVSKVKFNYGFPATNDEDDSDIEPNYYIMAKALRDSNVQYLSDLESKYQLRNPELNVPIDIDYIQINFVNQFVISEFYPIYYSNFGLEATSFFNFGKSGLFAVIDRTKFDKFLVGISLFIDYVLNTNRDSDFSSFNFATYINSYKLLTSRDIIRFKLEETGKVVYLSLIDLKLNYSFQQTLTEEVLKYLNINNIEFLFSESLNRIEIHNVDQNAIKILSENFDIIQSITCSISSVIAPTSLNTVNRVQGFTISNKNDELPIIGVIDTGISAKTPLSEILIQDNTFTLDGDPFIDNAGRGRNGHGTGVAGLAALGRENHSNQFNGNVKADAKLLSIKISSTGEGYISENNLIKMLYDARAKYPDMKIFVLTMCYSKFKAKNESFSNYTYELDKFAHNTNSLIFICTGNNDNCINENTEYDLEYFNSTHTNLCTPSDSLNNVTIGAAAENLNNGIFHGISNGREYPTLYSRKGHVDLKSVYPKNKTNKHYFKPDIIECGGDIGYINANSIDYTDPPALTILSARPEIGFIRETGTSYSAPLAANLAAKIINAYPTLHIQTVKALIINGASLSNIPFSKKVNHLQNLVAGNGIINIEKSLFSSENSATIILEDKIANNEVKIYPVNFPDYLINEELGRKKGILKITATLCFSFEPIENNQVSYNPIHIAFGFFKNQNADEINSKNDVNNSKLRNNLSWSQNGRHVSKPIPYSNTQKIHFTVDLNHLQSESKTLKLAIQSRISTQIIGEISSNYPKEFPFSLVITIEENMKNKTGKLYDELISLNNLELISDIELDSEVEI